MLSKLLWFILALCLMLGVLYGLHRLLLEGFFPERSLEFFLFSYKFNFGITLLFTSTLIMMSEQLKDQIGFVFLAETALKVGLFFYLSGVLGFEVDKSKLSDFFVPYLGCLAIELFFVIRLLKER